MFFYDEYDMRSDAPTRIYLYAPQDPERYDWTCVAFGKDKDKPLQVNMSFTLGSQAKEVRGNILHGEAMLNVMFAGGDYQHVYKYTTRDHRRRETELLNSLGGFPCIWSIILSPLFGSLSYAPLTSVKIIS